MIRKNRQVAREYQMATEDLLPFCDNLVAKCMLAKLYYLKYEYSSFQQATDYVKEGAYAGLAEAQLLYGHLILYLNGDAQSEALEWYKKAADQGHPEAICSMGLIHEDWYDKFGDFDEYQEIDYLKLAEDCYKSAETHDGIYHYACFQLSLGRPDDAKELLESISNDYPPANFTLGTLYSKPESQYLDYNKAYFYFKKYAPYGMIKTYQQLAYLYYTHNIAGPESDEYWIRKAIHVRELISQFSYEKDHRLPVLPKIPSKIQPIYGKYGYTPIGNNEDNNHSNSNTPNILLCIILIIVEIFLFRKCFW